MRTVKSIIATTAIATMMQSAAMAQADIITVEPSPACQGKAVKVSVKFNDASYKYAYISFGDQTDAYATPSNSDLQHIYREDKEYKISGYVLKDDNSKEDLVEKNLKVSAAPTLTITDDKAISLISTTADGDVTYTWYCGENKLQNTESSLYYMESGTFTVIATNPSGCQDTASVKVKYAGAADDDNTFINVKNNVLTPGSYDGCNDVLYIEDVADFAAPCEVKIFDTKGKLVYTNTNYTNTDGFQGKDDNGNELLAGTYYYVIKSQGRRGCAGFVDIIR